MIENSESEKEQIEQRLELCRQIALDIEDGRKSRYWKHLERKIKGWLEGEEKHWDLLKSRLIRLPEDVEERNDCVKKIALLKQILAINQEIIDENLTIISAMKFPVEDKFKRTSNFVGNKPND